MERLRVGGLRAHPGLTLLRLEGSPAVEHELTDYLARLADRRINLFFLALAVESGRVVATGCVESREGDRAREVALQLPSLAPHLTVIHPVCALSVFPHRNSLALLHGLLRALHGSGVPILAMASSLSAVTCSLPEPRLDQALAALEEVFELPENHTPIRLLLRHELVRRGEEP